MSRQPNGYLEGAGAVLRHADHGDMGGDRRSLLLAALLDLAELGANVSSLIHYPQQRASA
jgi:hypothetical protein